MPLTTDLHMPKEQMARIMLNVASILEVMLDLLTSDVLRPSVLCPAVLGFTEVMADSSNLGHFTLGLHDMGRYMRLDAAAQRALNVMKSRSDANDAFSLYGLMNRCKTVMGRRLLKETSLDHGTFTIPCCLLSGSSAYF